MYARVGAKVRARRDHEIDAGVRVDLERHVLDAAAARAHGDRAPRDRLREGERLACDGWFTLCGGHTASDTEHQDADVTKPHT